MVTVVNRDAVERVAPPPKLRVVEYRSPRWLAWAEAAACEGEEQASPMVEFMAQLARARRRLQCSSDYFE